LDLDGSAEFCSVGIVATERVLRPCPKQRTTRWSPAMTQVCAPRGDGVHLVGEGGGHLLRA